MEMGRQAPQGLLGIHVNMPATVPANIARALKSGEPAPSGLTPKEKAAYESMNRLYARGGGYAGVMVTRPQTLGYSLADSPVGQAAWVILTKSPRAATSRPGKSPSSSPRKCAPLSGRCAERPRASGCARGGGGLVRGPPAMRRLPRYAAASGAACPTRTDSRNCSRSSSSPRSSFSRSSKTPPNGRALRPRAVAVSTRFWEMCPASATIMR